MVLAYSDKSKRHTIILQIVYTGNFSRSNISKVSSSKHKKCSTKGIVAGHIHWIITQYLINQILNLA